MGRSPEAAPPRGGETLPRAASLTLGGSALVLCFCSESAADVWSPKFEFGGACGGGSARPRARRFDGEWAIADSTMARRNRGLPARPIANCFSSGRRCSPVRIGGSWVLFGSADSSSCALSHSGQALGSRGAVAGARVLETAGAAHVRLETRAAPPAVRVSGSGCKMLHSAHGAPRAGLGSPAGSRSISIHGPPKPAFRRESREGDSWTYARSQAWERNLVGHRR